MTYLLSLKMKKYKILASGKIISDFDLADVFDLALLYFPIAQNNIFYAMYDKSSSAELNDKIGKIFMKELYKKIKNEKIYNFT